ncbi:M20 family metallo-hydrolase [Levilactobacillus namurensis]|uniref:M20 family metallo-hydrolase n=1 Tax=Levilactobacillus namurensis TaxID=380393 RepID=A0AAW8W766_9LACO|nr:M20 family metallo-hydrolase [Levilactobacillus namurensis]MDT7014375.1 M20 family metallo-hydrolase [Levilactobacillus namurensis]
MSPLTTPSLTLAAQLATINRLCPTDPAQNRLVYTPTWTAAQAQLITWGLAAGLQATVDDFGTVYLDLPGQDNQTIATGSHMDTVVNGGRYDGLYGIIAGFQAITTLHRQLGRPQHTLRLIAFSEEEGSRFPLTFTGSKHYARQAVETSVVDAAGTSFEDARQLAVTPLQDHPGVHSGLPALPASFTELHIEQGPRLTQAHQQVGIVTGLVGQRRFTLTLKGRANHAGTTPMADRHDALQAAVTLIARLRHHAQVLDDALTFTVGRFEVVPNSANVIPGLVRFTVDCRHPSDLVLTEFERQLHQAVHALMAPQLTITIQRWVHDLPVCFDQRLTTQNQRLATQLNLRARRLTSGAGHDSGIMSSVVPTAMLFVPSVAGISHAPAELTSPTDLAHGVALLTASLRVQAYGGLA